MAIPQFKPEIQGFSIVVLGAFNPAIFHPSWFAAQKLIPQSEADSAKVNLIFNEACSFALEWVQVDIAHDRFGVISTDPTKYQPLRDLVIGTFAVLEHSPVTKFGFNTFSHFKMASEADWHRVGHYYAPKAAWQQVLNDPRTLAVAVQGTREKSDANRIQFRLEPSSKVMHGVHIAINEHYDLDEQKPAAERMTDFLRTTRDSFDKFLEYSTSSCQKLLSAGIAG